MCFRLGPYHVQMLHSRMQDFSQDFCMMELTLIKRLSKHNGRINADIPKKAFYSTLEVLYTGSNVLKLVKA